MNLNVSFSWITCTHTWTPHIHEHLAYMNTSHAWTPHTHEHLALMNTSHTIMKTEYLNTLCILLEHLIHTWTSHTHTWTTCTPHPPTKHKKIHMWTPHTSWYKNWTPKQLVHLHGTPRTLEHLVPIHLSISYAHLTICTPHPVPHHFMHLNISHSFPSLQWMTSSPPPKNKKNKKKPHVYLGTGHNYDMPAVSNVFYCLANYLSQFL